MCAAFLDDQLDRKLKNLAEQWDIAERRIKKAEQVRGNEVVSSAIFELRYAGRKIIDVINLAVENDWEHDPEVRDKIWFLSRMYARSVRRIGLLASSNRQQPAAFDAPQGRLPQCLRAYWHAGVSGALAV